MQKQAELYRGKAKTVYSTENPGPVGARSATIVTSAGMARALSSSIAKVW